MLFCLTPNESHGTISCLKMMKYLFMPVELKKRTGGIDPKLGKHVCFIQPTRILPVHNGKLGAMRRVVNDKALEILMMLGLLGELPETHLCTWIN